MFARRTLLLTIVPGLISGAASAGTTFTFSSIPYLVVRSTGSEFGRIATRFLRKSK